MSELTEKRDLKLAEVVDIVVGPVSGSGSQRPSECRMAGFLCWISWIDDLLQIRYVEGGMALDQLYGDFMQRLEGKRRGFIEVFMSRILITDIRLNLLQIRVEAALAFDQLLYSIRAAIKETHRLQRTSSSSNSRNRNKVHKNLVVLENLGSKLLQEQELLSS
ncbi:hypothetical protein Tco_0378813 [Tanacetum coccineum]